MKFEYDFVVTLSVIESSHECIRARQSCFKARRKRTLENKQDTQTEQKK